MSHRNSIISHFYHPSPRLNQQNCCTSKIFVPAKFFYQQNFCTSEIFLPAKFLYQNFYFASNFQYHTISILTSNPFLTKNPNNIFRCLTTYSQMVTIYNQTQYRTSNFYFLSNFKENFISLPTTIVCKFLLPHLKQKIFINQHIFLFFSAHRFIHQRFLLPASLSLLTQTNFQTTF